jgi:hypothetical protein
VPDEDDLGIGAVARRARLLQTDRRRIAVERRVEEQAGEERAQQYAATLRP